MTATFTYMARASEDPELAKKKVPVTAKVDPRLEEALDAFGKRMRVHGVHQHGNGGKSNAVEAVLEMAFYLGWFGDPDTFAAELMRHRADALAHDAEKSNKKK